MKKSVYSLVLMDDIVAAIDELAYSLQTSRSNLINQILAEKVALVTPEQRLQTIFAHLSDYLRPYQHFQIQNQAADHMYSIKSALRYKYNPTIRYCLYLNQQGEEVKGELRVISRTQSEVLHHYLEQFFQIWATIENRVGPTYWQREEGAKWLRVLKLKDFQNATAYEALAEALSEYISVLDGGLKLYFGQLDTQKDQTLTLMKHYELYLKNNETII